VLLHENKFRMRQYAMLTYL